MSYPNCDDIIKNRGLPFTGIYWQKRGESKNTEKLDDVILNGL